jgi:hypothetical protein
MAGVIILIYNIDETSNSQAILYKNFYAIKIIIDFTIKKPKESLLLT